MIELAERRPPSQSCCDANRVRAGLDSAGDAVARSSLQCS